jgi:hypothetical protein
VSGLRATVEGQVVRIDDKIRDDEPLRIVVLEDDSGQINVLFNDGRGADLTPGLQLRMTGKARQTGTRAIFLEDPMVEVLERE